ncbi:unknown protein [Seminavis robusta]|uniref:Uncharacterized protein n=1 Tax=Seminavis robusta TaxID=568900 RepID=A0A9N8HBQ8_9STRA|nr:unknown protein [Seminavis robusta]|eukprot:Sro191_g082290.1 n/a (1275) ;mRNA; f:57388-61212
MQLQEDIGCILGLQIEVAAMELRRRQNPFLEAINTTNDVQPASAPAPAPPPVALITPNEQVAVSQSSSVADNLLLALRDTISSRKTRNTPLFEFIKGGNKSFKEKGWLRRALLDADSAARFAIQERENYFLLLIFMGLSGTGPEVDEKSKQDTSPMALLSQAWGFSKPAVRRACGVPLDDDNFLDSLLPCEVRKRNKCASSWTPQAKANRLISEAEPDGFVSPDFAATRQSKKRDMKATPNLLSGMESLGLESPRTPTVMSAMRFFGRQDAFDAGRQQRTRLDFGERSPLIEETEEQSDATQTDPTHESKATQTEMKSRVQAEIKTHSISGDCEEEICRALFLLFQKKAVPIDQTSRTNENKILTVRQFRSGSSMKLLRIKQSRRWTKGDERGRKIKRKAQLVETLLDNLDVSESELLSILKIVGRNHSLHVFADDSECRLSIEQCAAMMQYLPTTVRGLERLSRFFKATLSSFGDQLFPTMLRKKLASYAMESFDLKLGFEMVSLEIGGEKRNERCLHAWVKEPAKVIETLTQSAIMAGKFEESAAFCKHHNQLTVVQGTDRGGDITLCLVRVANRSGGNAPQYCIPLAFYEYGKESYSNLEKTIFNPSKPTKNFLQKMLNGDFQMIVVEINEGSIAVDAQCCILDCATTLRIDRLPDSSTLRLEAYETPLPRLVTVFNEEESRNSEENPSRHKQFIQLVGKASNEATHEYTGLALTNCFGRDVFQATFREPLQITTTSSVRIRSLRIRGITADDIKCNTAVMGQGTAGVMCPCTMCIGRKKEFSRFLSLPSNQQPALRKGDNANPTLYDGFVEDAGGRVDWVRANSAGQAKTLKLRYHSVVHQPLLYTPPEHNSGSGMHVSSGLLTHLTMRMLDLLGKIDRELPWLEQLSPLMEEARRFSIASVKEAEKLRREDTRLQRDAKAAERLSMTTSQLNSISADRSELARKLKTKTKACESAKLFLEKGNDFLDGVAKKTKSRIVGPATYCFRKAYEVDGRVSFRVENSGFELSNGDGIRVLERRELISKRMKQLFPNNMQCQSRVEEIMVPFRRLTELLYEISTMMKSQRRWSDEDATKFDSITQQYAKLWLEFKSDKDGSSNGEEMNVFNKLHVLRAHLSAFATNNLMLGRCSEEGFESAHKRIEAIRQPLVCMTSTEARANNIFRRIMLQCRPEVEAIRLSIEERFGGKKRAPYKKTTRALKSADNAPAATDQTSQVRLLDGFIHSINGYVIKQGWKDHFEYVCFSKVPAAWTEPFSKDESLGGVYRANAEYI